MRQWLTCLCAALTFTAGASAQESAPVSLPGTLQYDLVSAVNGHSYRLYVAPPEGYAADDTTRYPVLYLLDGHFGFPAAVAARAAMGIQREMAEVIIVGIGNGEHTFDTWFLNRWRDYTPSSNVAADSAGARAFDLSPDAVHSGGAADFLRVLREEVIPHVEGTYRTSRDRGLSGHSFGGLFAAHAMFEAPGLFQRYGINSPSLWWNGGELFEKEAAFATQHTSLSAHVFLSVGSKEGGMVASMERFAEALRSRSYEGLAVENVVFEGETHGSVVPAMIARTLRVLYAPPAAAQR